MGPDEDGASVDARGQAEIEGRAEAGGPTSPEPTGGGPSAGPHAAPELTDPAATPGTGALPEPAPDDEADAATC